MSTTKAVAAKASASGKKRTITVRLKKSRISTPPDQRATMNGLGLKRIRQERTLENTPSVRGMIKKIIHLLDIVSETR